MATEMIGGTRHHALMSDKSRFVITTLLGQLVSLGILTLSACNVGLKRDFSIALFWTLVVTLSAVFVWHLVVPWRHKTNRTRNLGLATIGLFWGGCTYFLIASLTSFLIVNLKFPLWFIILSGTLPACFAESNDRLTLFRAVIAWISVFAMGLSVTWLRATIGIRHETLAVLVALPKGTASANMIAPIQEDVVLFQPEFDRIKESVGELTPQGTIRVGIGTNVPAKRILLVLTKQLPNEIQVPEPESDSAIVVDGPNWRVFPESTRLSPRTMTLYPTGDTCVALSLWKSWGHDVTRTAACWKKPS